MRFERIMLILPAILIGACREDCDQRPPATSPAMTATDSETASATGAATAPVSNRIPDAATAIGGVNEPLDSEAKPK